MVPRAGDEALGVEPGVYPGSGARGAAPTSRVETRRSKRGVGFESLSPRVLFFDVIAVRSHVRRAT